MITQRTSSLSLLAVLVQIWALLGVGPARLYEPTQRPPATGILITVVDAWTGRPVAEATVSALFTRRIVHTQADGTAYLPWTISGPRVVVSHPGYLPALRIGVRRDAATIRLIPRRLTGRVLDQSNGQPIAGAWVHLGDQLIRTDKTGTFTVTVASPAPAVSLLVRAAGYARGRWVLGNPQRAAQPAWDAVQPLQAERASAHLQPVDCTAPPCVEIQLAPFSVHAFYIPLALLSRPDRIEALLDMAQQSPAINGVVLDVKGDRGRLAWRGQEPIALAADAYQGKRGWLSLEEFIRMARARDLYVIARMVLFKDERLAAYKPEWAIRQADDTVWTDSRGVPWVNPFLEDVWNYQIALAREVAAFGVDEIQLDYVRFPSDGALGAIRYDRESTAETRTAAIRQFVERFANAVRPLGVFTAADVFGLTVWVMPEHDMGIGQRVMDIGPWVDYLSPMIYPSTFIPGNLGLDDPKAYPYQVIYRSVQQAVERVPPGTHVRPWLQAYSYSLAEMWLQRHAAEDTPAAGWMFWNAAGVYPAELFGPLPDIEEVRALLAQQRDAEAAAASAPDSGPSE